MNTLLILARGLVLFVALFGFLFGQVFAGHFTPGAGLAGIFGLFSALVGTTRLQASPRWARAVALSCLLALHDGEFFHPLWVWVNDLAAVAALVLLWSGWFKWWHHRRRLRARAGAIGSGQEPGTG